MTSLERIVMYGFHYAQPSSISKSLVLGLSLHDDIRRDFAELAVSMNRESRLTLHAFVKRLAESRAKIKTLTGKMVTIERATHRDRVAAWRDHAAWAGSQVAFLATEGKYFGLKRPEIVS